MTGLTNQQLLQEIINWMYSRVARLPDYGQPFFSQGGWEGWIQVELAMYLTSRDYDVVRESRIYNMNNYRADLVVNSNINGVKNIAVEIKCQSIYSQQYLQLNTYEHDIQRLKLLGTDWNAIMLIFVVEPNLSDLLSRNGYAYFTTPNMTLCYKEIISVE